MEESSAPPIEDEGHGQRTLINTNYGWGIPGYSAPSTGNPYPPHYPPPYYTPPVEQAGLYPNITFGYPPAAPPPYQQTGVRPFMQCPICRERLMKPIYQCQNGHVICNRCIDRYEFCTECSASLVGPKIRNIALEKIVQESNQAQPAQPYGHSWGMTEVRCPNYGDGCEVLTSSDGIRSHLEVCDFRPLPFCSKILGWSHCSSEVNSSSILGHLRDHHENQIVEKEEARFSLKLVIPNNTIHGAMSGRGLIWEPIVITALDIPALIKCVISPNGNLFLNGYLLGGSIHDTRNYRVKYELNSSAKTSRLEWTGSLLSFRHLHHSDLLPNVNTFRMPIETLKEFFKDFSEGDSQSRLNIRICLWKIGDNHFPFRECFRNVETMEKDPLEKTTLISVPLDDSHSFSFNDTLNISSHTTTSTSYSYSDIQSSAFTSSCTNCSRPLYGVTYQCLQCPEATYFCRHCIEARNAHGEHLTLRISNGELQVPLAAVVYECASGEIS